MSPSPSSSNSGILVGILCGMGAGALWGLVFLAPELARAFSPLQLTIGRYLAYGLLSAALIAPRWRTLRAGLGREEWLALGWLSLCGNTLYYILMSSAVQLGGIALTSLVIGFMPVVVTIVGSRDHGAVPLVRLWPSLVLCAIGAICVGWQAVSSPASGSSVAQWAGLACAVGALLVWTAYAVGNSRWLTRLERVSAHDWSLLTGVVTGAQAVALIPLGLMLDRFDQGAEAWLQFAGVSVGVAVLASIVGNALWNRMNRLLPLTLVGQMILFETLFALLYAFIWEQRLPTLLEAVAFVVVTVSVILCVSAHRRPVAAQAPALT